MPLRRQNLHEEPWAIGGVPYRFPKKDETSGGSCEKSRCEFGEIVVEEGAGELAEREEFGGSDKKAISGTSDGRGEIGIVAKRRWEAANAAKFGPPTVLSLESEDLDEGWEDRQLEMLVDRCVISFKLAAESQGSSDVENAITRIESQRNVCAMVEE